MGGKGGRPGSKVDLMELFSIPCLANVSETLPELAGFRLPTCSLYVQM